MRHYFLGTNAGISRAEREYRKKGEATKNSLEELALFLREHYEAKEVIITRNGRSAIAAGLTYGLEEKGEVIINGFTCYAVVQGVKAAGMTPVYADISKENLNFTIAELERVLTKNTKAIIIQNTLGNMVNIREFEAFCKKYKLVLIEDLAHSQGRKYPDGREAGTIGEMTIFSFGKEKVVDAGGGGALIIRDEKVLRGKKVVTPRESPIEKEEFRARIYPTIGKIYRDLSYVNLQGIFMRLMLKIGYVKKSADGDIDFKKHQLGFLQAELACKKSRELPKNPEKIREFYLVDDREQVLRELKESGYYFEGFWYERPVSPERYYKKVNFPEERCKNAVFISKHIINFPNYYTKEELAPAHKIIEKHLIGEKDG